MRFSTFLVTPFVVATAKTAGAAEREVFAQAGSITYNSTIITVRCNSPVASEVRVMYKPHARHGVTRVMEGYAPRINDYTLSILLPELQSNIRYEYRVECDPLDGTSSSYSNRGSFFTAPLPMDGANTIEFVFGGSMASNGWGRNPDLSVISYVNREEVLGGYVIFEVMRQLHPHFAIFQGDMIDADTPIPATKSIDESVEDGTWRNIPDSDFVAMDTEGFREKWRYNLGDERFSTFLEEVPVYVQWDDGEVEKFWVPEDTDPDLQADALEAFYEYNPILEGGRLFYKQQHGRNVEIFFLDLRSYKEPNKDNEREYGIKMMGPNQTSWLVEGLRTSTAKWKIISSPVPFSFVVFDFEGGTDSWGQGNVEGLGNEAILGREKELKYLHDKIKEHNITNVVVLSSDVHHAAVVEYPDMYEFVAGPLHAGAFGPLLLDPSFGPKLLFSQGPDKHDLAQGLPPPFFQHFGYVRANSTGLTVSIHDIEGKELYGMHLC